MQEQIFQTAKQIMVYSNIGDGQVHLPWLKALIVGSGESVHIDSKKLELIAHNKRFGISDVVTLLDHRKVYSVFKFLRHAGQAIRSKHSRNISHPFPYRFLFHYSGGKNMCFPFRGIIAPLLKAIIAFLVLSIVTETHAQNPKQFYLEKLVSDSSTAECHFTGKISNTSLKINGTSFEYRANMRWGKSVIINGRIDFNDGLCWNFIPIGSEFPLELKECGRYDGRHRILQFEEGKTCSSKADWRECPVGNMGGVSGCE